MTAIPFNPFVTYTDSSGNPLVGGKIFTYAAGTTTPLASYTDASGATPATNPIVLDAAGRSPYGAIWGSGAYKFVLADSTGAVIQTDDNVTAAFGAGDMNKTVYDPANIAQQVVGTTATQTVSNKTFDSSNTFSGLAVSYSAISGYLPSSIAGTNTTAILTVSAGQAANSANSTYITKATTTSWAVSNGNALNGYEGGTTLPNSSTIHFYAIQTSAGASQGVFASTSLTPTLPGTHTGGTYRRIFSVRTTGAGALIPYTATEVQGGGINCYLSTVVQDIASTTVISASRQAQTLGSVPTGVAFQVKIIAQTVGAGAVIWLSGADEPDTLPSAVPGVTSPGATLAASNTTSQYLYFPWEGTTNTSAQIFARGNTGTANTLYATTRGWLDFRR